MIYKSILIGLDGSDQAKRAFATGLSLAKVLSADLHIAWVVNRDRSIDASFGVNEDFYRDMAERVQQKMTPYIKKAQEKNVNVVDHAVVGNIKLVLTKDLPEENDIDLIIVGKTGANVVEKMLQGSHSGYIVSHSNCDVLVVE